MLFLYLYPRKKKFSNKDDGDIIAYNIKNNVLAEYAPLIKSALCDLYIYNINKSRADRKEEPKPLGEVYSMVQ